MSTLEDQSQVNQPQGDNKNRIIYRSIIDKSKKLDEIYQQSDSFYRIFQSETILLRDKLQKYCETLIFREPIQYAKKAEEILWRKGFYEIIRIIKLNKKNLKINSEIESMYRLHLASAYGFYNHLILRFQSEFRSVLQLEGFLNFPIISYEKIPLQEKTEKKDLLREVAIRILHKLLICMGDLTRYHLEYDPNSSNKKDSKYYLMSLMLLPSNGMPLNQLGTLFSSENYGCDAAYYYLYSLCCTEPFYGAGENLKLLFLKNRKRYDEIKSKNFIDRSKLGDYEPDDLRTKEIKKFLVLFLYIIDLILSQTNIITSNSNKIENQQLQELCQFSLQQFNSCMFYLKNSDPRKPYISDDLVFKLMLLILMSIEQLKCKKQTQTKCQNDVYFTVVAYGLIFFSYILNHCIIRFEQSILVSKNNRILISSEEENLEISLGRDTTEEKLADPKNSKKKSHLLYGHRRSNHYSDSDTNESESEMNRTWDSEAESSDENGQQSRRPGPRRRKNVARFIERENLSETELNPYNSESSDYSSSSDDSSSELSENESTKNSIQNESLKQEQQQKQQQSNPSLRPIFSNPVIDNDELLNDNYLNNSNLSTNFKELSLQLFSDFGSLPTYSPSSNSINYQLNSDEFVDNEIYKFILNGKKQVSVPPGFEINTKEVQEIEELGKKIASFQIETDTEMSVINSDNSDKSDFDDDEDKKSDLDNAKLTIEILEYQKLLATVKVFSDWLLCNKKIIQSISKIATTMWPKLAVLLNIIPSEKQIMSNSICTNKYVRNLITKSLETKSWNNQPLSEDIHMRALNALKLEHLSLKFDLNKLNQLSVFDEHLLRLCLLRRFGYLMASFSQSQKSCGGFNFFEYDLKNNTFTSVQIENVNKSEKKPEPSVSKEDQRLKLMKSMAQLRLEAEISQLESTCRAEENQWSPYLVMDTSVICENLKIVQELSRSNKFLIIIPLTVIDQIDLMKKESKQAREAIKWLEIQFKNGNRFLRAQNQHEVIEKANLNLKKKDFELWRYSQIIDCCNFFQKQFTQSNQDAKQSNIVSLLTNNYERFSSEKFDNLTKLAKDNGIQILKAVEFYDAWKK